ncbi:hypothetical protein D9M72_452310 [compost metagenome]
MIALLHRNELIALRLAAGIPIIADEADRAVDGVGAAEREIDVVEIARRALGEFRGEADRGLGAEPEIGRRIGKLAHLPGGRFDDRFVAIAGIDAPKAGKAVDQLLARSVGDRRAFCRGEYAHAEFFMAAIGGDRMDEVGAIEFDEGIAVHDDLRISRAPDWRGRRW